MDFIIKFIKSSVDIDLELTRLKKFPKKDRSSFSYWWNHWKAFNLLAIKLNVWKVKWLFHDWEKPWLRLIGIPYEKLQQIHRSNSDHHVEYCKGPRDFLAMALDWEASRFTKLNAAMTARETMEKLHPEVTLQLNPVLIILNL